MKTWSARWLPLLVLPLLAACGGGGSTGGATTAPTPATPTTTPGTLVYSTPLRQVSLTAADFKASLTASASGAQLYALAAGGSATATLPCGIDVYKIQFYTTGGAGEQTESSGAVMVPTGAGCTGPRPILLYAHGTTVDKAYDISALQVPSNAANGESALVAAIFASNGFIVVAPNYAGYDTSTLGYTPYLNAKQEAGEMEDALTAARSALPTIGNTGDLGALFVTGYSQGGHVAVATVRALEAAGKTVTASAGLSGPYAMEAFGDAIYGGNVDVGATVFVPLLTTSYQKAYGNIYSATTDIYTSTYANGIATLLPSTTPIDTLFQQNLLPQTALFDIAPTGAFASLPQNPEAALNGDFGFGASFLISDLSRATYLADAAANPDPALAGTGILPSTTAASTTRIALRTNDLRMKDGNGTPASFGLWLPRSPMLLCAGGADTTVFAFNTKILGTYFGAAAQAGGSPLIPSVLNIDTSSTSTAQLTSSFNPLTTDATANATLQGTFAALQAGFTQSIGAVTAAGGASAAFADYHGTVAPLCTAAAASWFKYVASLAP